jgi:type IV pilus assembly protein PilE
MRNSRGFTLIEVMIVSAVIAILAALALPAYSQYIQRSRRVEGQALLNRVMQAQEKYFSTYNRYTTDLTGPGPNGLALVPNPGGPDCPAGQILSENCYYAVTAVFPAAGNQNVRLIATPRLAQAIDKCVNLRITAAGIKDFTGNTNNGKCW